MLTGRLDLVLMVSPEGLTFASYTIYGWTGGHGNAQNAARTNDLLRIIGIDAKTKEGTAVLISGDINGEVEDSSYLWKML